MQLNHKQKDGAVLPKPNSIVYIGRSQKQFLNLTPNPKIALKGINKSGKKAPIMAKSKTNRRGCTSTNQSCKSFLKSAFQGLSMPQSWVFQYSISTIFLAAMSSSSSDHVTPLVGPSVRNDFLILHLPALQDKTFDIYDS